MTGDALDIADGDSNLIGTRLCLLMSIGMGVHGNPNMLETLVSLEGALGSRAWGGLCKNDDTDTRPIDSYPSSFRHHRTYHTLWVTIVYIFFIIR